MITINGEQVNITMFPDNTSQVWKLPESIMRGRQWGFINWEYMHEGELMQIAQLRDLLANSGIHASLYMSYLPYGRQDKQIKNDQTFALRSFARVLNALNFDKISVLDPHSDVAKELIEGLEILSPLDFITRAMDAVTPDVICYPDEGAKKRYSQIIDFPSIFCDKTRNQETGEITGLEVIGNPMEQKVLIVDDICDGGATFTRIAKFMQPLAKEINLYVTHGIFSKGVNVLKNAGIKRIFTKDGEAFQMNTGNTAYMPYTY